MQRCRVLGRIVNKAYWPLQWENTITYHNTLCWSLQECSDWGPVHTYPDIFESANFSLRILKLINNSWRYKPTRSPHSGQVDDFETHWNISWKSLVFHHVFITSERHFKLQTDWLFFFLFRFQTNASSNPILHFCVQYSSKDSKSNEEKEKIDAISLRFKRLNFVQFVVGKRNLPSAMAKTICKSLQVHNAFGIQNWCNAKYYQILVCRLTCSRR